MGVAAWNKLNFWGGTVTAVARQSGGRVFSCIVVNANASLRYFQLFDRTTALASGAVPVVEIPIIASSTGPSAFGPEAFGAEGTQFFTGIVWGVSTAQGSYTAATASDHDVTLLISN